ncbi:MAG: redoxin domain-containing protein [Chloroflexota bacterium]|nr:redoxin domain-containing protein [Chloroflexota bacterium]
MQDRKKTYKATFAIIGIFLLLVCTIGCAVPVGSQVGDKAPDFTLSTLDGGAVKLGDLKGNPVVLSFWTTSCTACIYQMPFLEAASSEVGDEVEFVAIDMGENSYAVKATVDYYGFNLQVALDSDETVSTAYNIIYTPTNVIIDKQGNIHYIRTGAFTSTAEILNILNDIE